MASNPGPFTEWPWKKLGNFKYALVLPWMAHSVYHLVTNKENGRLDYFNLSIIPMQVMRIIHTQFWISLARFQTARSRHRILDKSIEFEQVDRERNWDDQVILTTLLLYLVNALVPTASHVPWWNTKGVIFTVLVHAGPVEFLYYWFHRALHHHYLYSRYHSHHHSSIVTEPITSVIHPFGELVVYFMLFAMPFVAMEFTRSDSIVAAFGYLIYIDLMNFMGHCNFELVPPSLFRIFPPLKYLMYTPSFHSLHHTQFRTNYSLFMPLYDYMYGTMDKSSDELYEKTVKGKEVAPDVIHLTHPTNLLSFFHLRLGFSSLASSPYGSTWYTWLTWPLSWLSLALASFLKSAFTIERNRMDKLEVQTWAIPRYTFQYKMSRQKGAINDLIEKSIKEAEEKGAKVVSLGLLNQDVELNNSGELYLERNPDLNIKIVDGSSLAVAVVLHNIPEGTKQVLLTGRVTKVAHMLTKALCQKRTRVITMERRVYETLKLKLPTNCGSQLILSNDYSPRVWLVGELTKEAQEKAVKGTRFIPFSQFPVKNACRRDCVYHSTPAMAVPKSLENMHSCENWLPRRVMSAWKVAGMVHALEGWQSHEVGDAMAMSLDMDRALQAALKHGFSLLALPPVQA